ncbi:auxin response factor 5-like [Papaver somniferum]|uniref:auxin response factor 5-like n=1 Tax=Papaver somniferum TaxID=3469 RepID=UPI000E6FE130|nr:auxin response factor 5-like [Papaver somniferum]
MDGNGGQYNPRTVVEEVFRDFKGRRAGMIKAITSDVEAFFMQCDPVVKFWGYFESSNGGSTIIDPSVSSTAFDGIGSLGIEGFQSSNCLVGNFSSNQDVQSQITTASMVDSQAFSLQELQDNSGGTSSSNIDLDDTGLLQNGSWQQISPPLRTYTKVQKVGSVGRSIDVTRFKNYDDLRYAIACMFGLDGMLDDPRGSSWKLVYVDYENDVLLVGDDPWEEFVSCVRCIRILSPSEVQQMSGDKMDLSSNTVV